MRRNKLQTIIAMSCYVVIRLPLTAIMAGGHYGGQMMIKITF